MSELEEEVRRNDNDLEGALRVLDTESGHRVSAIKKDSRHWVSII